jgi:hypothetical protein
MPIFMLREMGTPVTPNHFWQACFYDFKVWTEHKRIEKLRYITGCDLECLPPHSSKRRCRS